MRIFYKGFNFSQDGPGNRLVYHLSGCNLSCPWCSNPEGMDFSAGKEIPETEIISEILRSRPMFFSGGGVTFTGGEATMQSESLVAVLSAVRKEGVNTALETNGTGVCLLEIAPLVDHLMMDFKHYDKERFKTFTGGDIVVLKRNFEGLLAQGKAIHIRIPLIGGFNSDNPEGFLEYFTRFDTERVDFEFLPYHEYGKAKWKGGYSYQNGFISKETLEKFKETFKSGGLKVINT